MKKSKPMQPGASRPGFRISTPDVDLPDQALDRLAHGMAMVKGVAFVYLVRAIVPGPMDRHSHAFFVFVSRAHKGHTRYIREQAEIVVRAALSGNKNFQTVIVDWDPEILKPVMKVGQCVVLKKRHDYSAAKSAVSA